MALKLPKDILHRVRHVEQKGHRLTSLGCALFRCVLCDERMFLDDSSVPGNLKDCPRREPGFKLSEFY